jgi:hypothetical protein
MRKVVLDSNIWDLLASDDAARVRTHDLCQAGELQIVVPHRLARELDDAPQFRGVPDWFQTQVTPDSVGVIGEMMIGFAPIADGEIYAAHRGTKRAMADSIIVDGADTNADLYVSEDRRSREQYERLRPGRSMNFATFRVEVLRL